MEGQTRLERGRPITSIHNFTIEVVKVQLKNRHAKLGNWELLVKEYEVPAGITYEQVIKLIQEFARLESQCGNLKLE